MILLRLNEDKTLTIVSKNKIYQYENNAQQIELLVPKCLDGKDVSSCKVYLFGCFDNEFGSRIELSHTEPYKSSHIKFSNSLSGDMTREFGSIDVWIVLEDNEYKFESDSVNLEVEASKEIELDSKIKDYNMFTASINQMKLCEKACIDLVKMCESYKEQCEKIVGLGIEVYESIEEKVKSINE